MGKYLRMVKPLDIIIVSLLVILSFLPLAIFTIVTPSAENTQLYASIMVNHKEIKKIYLTGQNDVLEYRYEDEDGDYNLIQVKDQQIAIIDANCGDLRCLDFGFIGKVGQTIVCLPHQLIIEVKSTGKAPKDDEDEIIVPGMVMTQLFNLVSREVYE